MNKMDQTWVPSMPPLLSPNLEVFGLGFWHFALTRKKEKLGNFEGKTMGQRLYTTILKWSSLSAEILLGTHVWSILFMSIFIL